MIVDNVRNEYVSALTEEKTILTTLKTMPKGSIYTRKKRKGNKIYLYFVHQFYEKGKRFAKHVKRSDEQNLKEKFDIKKELLLHLSEVKEKLKTLRRVLKAFRLDPEIVKEEERQRIRDLKNRKQSKKVAKENAIKKDKYKNTKQVTAKGMFVRSKSEIVLCLLLDHYEISYEYEKPITLNGITFRPDLTIQAKDGIVYWEHRGMADDKEYELNWDEKKRIYTENGIREGKNLIVTYDREDGSIDAEEIRYLIEKYLL